MRSIGIRELRQQASTYLRDVERGETVEVTDRGRPVARLVPVGRSDPRAELITSGRLARGEGDLVKLVVREPESTALRRYLRSDEARFSCGLARVEVVRAVRPHGARAVSRARAVLGRIDLLRLDDALLDGAARMDPSSLRSLDAIHLAAAMARSEEHTSELQSLAYLVCRLLLEKKKKKEIKVYSLINIQRAQISK